MNGLGPARSRPVGRPTTGPTVRPSHPILKNSNSSISNSANGAKANTGASMAATYQHERMQQLENLIQEQKKTIAKLTEENKTLTAMQRRQDKAIQSLNRDQGDLPAAMGQLREELRAVKAQNKKYVERLNQEERQTRELHNELVAQREKSDRVVQRLKGVQDDLQAQIRELTSRLEQYEGVSTEEDKARPHARSETTLSSRAPLLVDRSAHSMSRVSVRSTAMPTASRSIKAPADSHAVKELHAPSRVVAAISPEPTNSDDPPSTSAVVLGEDAIFESVPAPDTTEVLVDRDRKQAAEPLPSASEGNASSPSSFPAAPTASTTFPTAPVSVAPTVPAVSMLPVVPAAVPALAASAPVQQPATVFKPNLASRSWAPLGPPPLTSSPAPETTMSSAALNPLALLDRPLGTSSDVLNPLGLLNNPLGTSAVGNPLGLLDKSPTTSSSPPLSASTKPSFATSLPTGLNWMAPSTTANATTSPLSVPAVAAPVAPSAFTSSPVPRPAPSIASFLTTTTAASKPSATPAAVTTSFTSLSTSPPRAATDTASALPLFLRQDAPAVVRPGGLSFIIPSGDAAPKPVAPARAQPAAAASFLDAYAPSFGTVSATEPPAVAGRRRNMAETGLF
ncbi:hypothetical protein AMAG_05223 [Allomyces macrogynus ATCC 38327]|uniref:Lebercilin domain-containing protein n=1 Tax=Allomyces macrogynus (strain ATCC 38327) TaxID=578462 RepID=A0A0L0SBI8_ALLM3|nr:hypothetical protein AMAG_05223 [Allomyces macrogynus ATCC 38327]|eukprot:KNE59760.1 hypothetical protein AMAG_05223 [Allomyces macrogynus ATCC 38327]